MFVSNESPTLVDVYFDDVTMTYTPGNILQYNEYYPFGLSTANSWTRENTTGNNFLYNGGTELNTTTQVYDLHYRNYDPVLGRMNQVDPVASKYGSVTPYNYAFNAPTNMNDPLGDDPGSSASCSWCNPKPRPIDTGSGGGGGGGSPFAGLLGRSAGFFEPGWQPGMGSLSTYGGMTGAQFSQWADKFKSKSDRLFFQSSYAAATNTPYAQASFVMGQNGVDQGYNVLLSITGRLLYLTKDNRVAQRANGGWVSTGSTTVYDFLANTSFSFGSSSPTTAPSGWDKFWSGFLGSKSEMQFASGTANGVGFTATVAEAALGVEARNGATALIRADAAAGSKLLSKAIGPGIAGAGVLFSTIESATDENGYTPGDIGKTLIGVGLFAAAFTVAAPAVAIYGIVDLGFAVFTGSSITDRIGSGIDSALKN
jgi:RHS repeat-associated protein